MCTPVGFADNRSAAVAANVQLAQAVYQYARTGDPAGALAEFVAYMRGQREGHLDAPEPGTPPTVAAVELAADPHAAELRAIDRMLAAVPDATVITPRGIYGGGGPPMPADDAPEAEPSAERGAP